MSRGGRYDCNPQPYDCRLSRRNHHEARVLHGSKQTAPSDQLVSERGQGEARRTIIRRTVSFAARCHSPHRQGMPETKLNLATSAFFDKRDRLKGGDLSRSSPPIPISQVPGIRSRGSTDTTDNP